MIIISKTVNWLKIVKATYFNPKIVVVDETTTALSQEGREELYKQMNRVRDNGNTVILYFP